MKREHMELTRRKLLGSLGAVGATSAAAGLGTTAYFNDTEQFEDNELTAGQLDLVARWEVTYYGASETLELHDGFSALGDENLCGASATTRPTIDLQDVKPGDEVLVRFDLQACTNPGYLWMNGGIQSNDDNGETEPEAAVNPPGPLGELPQSLRSQIYVRPGVSSFDDVEALTGGVGGASPTANGVTEVFPQDVSLSQALSTLSSGIGLGLQGDVSPSGTRNCFSGSTAQDATGGKHQVAMRITAPTSVGNVIQSDTFSLDLGFYGEQCRHNDGSGTNGAQPSPVVSAADATADATTTHSVRIPEGAIDSFSPPSGLDSVTIDYPADFDVGSASSTGGVIEKGGGTTVPITPTGTTLSDGDTAIELSFDGSADVASGDTIALFLNNVTNASSPGTYDVDLQVNGNDAGSATLEIS